MTKSRKKSTKIKAVEVPYDGLREWYTHMFEELGWMVITKKHGMMDKIAVYKNSLLRLKKSILHKIGQLQDQDKKRDLEIMLQNLECLINHVNKDFD